MSTRAADDAEIISRRLKELKAEREAERNCLCRRSDDGHVIDASQCAVHRAPVDYSYCLRAPTEAADDEERVRELARDWVDGA